MASFNIILVLKHGQNFPDGLLRLHVPIIRSCVDMVNATTQYRGLYRVIKIKVSLVIRVTHVSSDPYRGDPHLIILEQRLEIMYLKFCEDRSKNREVI